MNRRAFTASLAASLVAAQNKVFDIAVIGAGVFGAWTAHFLQRRGQSAALVDAYGPANSRASSGGESRVIRMGYGADEIYTRWSMRSLDLWTEFFAQVKQPLFHRTGVLWIGRDDHAYTLDSRRTLEKCGVKFTTLDANELSRRYPQILFDPGVTGTLEPESGALMARRAVQSVVEECIHLGCEYLHDAVAAPARRGKLEYLDTSPAAAFAQADLFSRAGCGWARSSRVYCPNGCSQPGRRSSFSAFRQGTGASPLHRCRYGSTSATNRGRMGCQTLKAGGSKSPSIGMAVHSIPTRITAE